MPSSPTTGPLKRTWTFYAGTCRRCWLRRFMRGCPTRLGRRMPCENINEMMLAARRGGYAVGYFESWNLESLQGVVDAAEQSRSPMILGFNGEFLSGPERIAQERLELYAAVGRAACAS